LHILVVSNCRATGLTWVEVAEQHGVSALAVSEREFRTVNARQQALEPDLVLWDDSSFDTWNALAGDSESRQLAYFAGTAIKHFPRAVRVAAMKMPRWDLWRQARIDGVHELIVKPGSAAALLRILAERCSSPGLGV
jgi:hypothetical protein